MTFIQAAHHSSGSNLPPTRVVIHATCPELGFPKASAKGRAVSTARYFQSAASGGSAHYVVDVGETVQCLGENVIAWHAPPNAHSLGIEICADGGSATSFKNPSVRYSRAQWLSPQVWPAVLRAAALTRQMCQKYDIPMVKLTPADLKAGKKGICGHVDVTNAFHRSDHDDPGPDFPWVEFIAAVKGGTTTQTGDLTVADITSLTNLIKSNQSQTHHDIGAVQTKLAQMDAVKNPRTGKTWRLKDAIWSIWYYTLENRDRIAAIEKKVK